MRINHSNKQLGRFGEELAADYLKSKDFLVLDRNFHTRYGEIDIVAKKDDIFYFVEVKTRTNLAFGWPEEAVTDSKLEKLMVAAEEYLEKNNLENEWQIDIISILIHKYDKTADINHIQNIS